MITIQKYLACVLCGLTSACGLMTEYPPWLLLRVFPIHDTWLRCIATFLCLYWMTPILQRAFNWPPKPFGENIYAWASTRLYCSFFFFFFVGKVSWRQVLIESAWSRTEIISKRKFIHTDVLKCYFWTVSLVIEVSKIHCVKTFHVK